MSSNTSINIHIDGDGITNLINMDQSGTLIQAERIDLVGKVTAADLQAGSVTADKLDAGAVTAEKLATGIIESIADQITITADNIHIGPSGSSQTLTDALSGINSDISNLESNICYRLEIVATSDLLSSAIQSTTLSARVWYGSENVTDSLSASRFNWKRVSSVSAADRLWNADHTGMKTITLTVQDVLYSATYTCELEEAS